MFYNNSEVEFPNWWDDLDGKNPRLGEMSEFNKTAVDRIPTDRISESEGNDHSGRAVQGFRVTESEEQLEGSHRMRVVYERDILFRVWEYGEIVPGNDADLWRKDEFGNWIYRLDYGNRESEFGWEIFDLGVGRKTQGVYVMRPMQWQAYLAVDDH